VCLSIAIARPGDVLARGEHLGFEWVVTNNGDGYRCGYVRVPAGHPWHGKDDSELGDTVECHGGVTFAEPDVECHAGPDDAYWIGFDCRHGGDLPDPELTPPPPASLPENFARMISDAFDFGRPEGAAVRTQEYVEAQCRSLCEQAHSVGPAAQPT
jgi:hypothetical protein